jgi:hypothetical protein
MCIGNDVTESIHEQFDVICVLEQMIQDEILN